MAKKIVKINDVIANGLVCSRNQHLGLVNVDENQVQLCRQFLADKAKSSRVNSQYTSYNFKHWVEKYFESQGKDVYVTNGAFIKAALLEGFRVVRSRVDGLNAQINLDTKELKALYAGKA